MKISVEVNNIAQSPVADDFFAPIVKAAVLQSGIKFKSKNISVSVALVSPSEIKKLNRKYRRINKLTDVLSFAEYKSAQAISKSVDRPILLGEIILCYDDVRAYAQKQKLDVKKELAKAAAHGTLHLLGFNHGKKMFAVQAAIINPKKL